MSGKALSLDAAEKRATLNAAPPYEATLTYSDSSTLTFAASLEDGTPTITPERATWLRDANGNLLFDSNKQLLEVAP